MERNTKKMKTITLDELVDDVWGKIGTPKRDQMESQLKEEIDAYYIGEAIKTARLEQHLTQEELGERIGVKKHQISKLEKGKSMISLPTISRIFKALGFNSGTLKLGDTTEIALW